MLSCGNKDFHFFFFFLYSCLSLSFTNPDISEHIFFFLFFFILLAFCTQDIGKDIFAKFALFFLFPIRKGQVINCTANVYLVSNYSQQSCGTFILKNHCKFDQYHVKSCIWSKLVDSLDLFVILIC